MTRHMIDACAANITFCIWSDSNQMSNDRLRALFSIYQNIDAPVAFLNAQTLMGWQKPDAPFHEAFQYLSATHKADYLRVYLMHHFGGGYTDIKLTYKSWKPLFEQLNASEKWGLGYQEIAPQGVAPVGGALELELKQNYQSLIGLCAFIFKRNTPFTQEWIDKTHAFLDEKLEGLKQNPARFPQDQRGITLPDGTQSLYPIKWTELLGNIFHPLILKYSTQIIQADIAPVFHSYR